MKTELQSVLIGLVLLAGLAQTQTACAAVNFSVTPTAVSNTFNGTITLQIGGLTNTETVVVQKFLDLNTNGVVDGGDLLIEQFNLTDGQAGMVIGGVTNFNVPGDTDGTANGQITATLNFQNGDFMQNIIGKYLFKLSSPVGHFAPRTIQFAVENFPFAQKIAGNVVSNSTSTTVPNAIAFLLSPPSMGQSGPGNPLGGVVANNAGTYAIQMPPGTYVPVVLSSNYVCIYAASPVLTLAAGQAITTNLTLTNASSSISGTVADADNSNIALPGLCVFAEDAQNGLIAFTCTDTSGNFNMRVTAGQWGLGAEPYPALGVRGYVGWYNDPVNNTNAGATGVNLDYPKATALFYGSVKDNLGNPMSGIHVGSSDNNNLYYMEGYTDANGDYVLGVLGGLNNDPWQVELGAEHNPTNYIFSYPDVDLNGGTNLTVGGAALVNFTAILATNHITGSLKDDHGNPIVGVGIWADATIDGVFYHIYSVETDTNGNYSLNVANGTMDVGGFVGLPDNYAIPADQFAVISNNDAVVNFTATLLALEITTTALPDGTNGVAYSQQLSADYGQPPYGWSLVSGSLPPGLTLATNGVVSGTPTTGAFDFTAKVTDATNGTATQTFTLTISVSSLQITTASLPDGTQGVAYSQQLSADYGQPPYSWSLISGSLPSGLTLATDGVISGTPTFAETTSFTVEVTDAATETATNTLSLSALLLLKTLHSFTGGSDGGNSYGGLILSGNTLYGTAYSGGSSGNGTVFKVHTDGTGFTNLYTFTATDGTGRNSDGADPFAGLILSGNTLYGVAYNGGNGYGTVFAVNTDGSGFTNLHSFTYYDGMSPQGGLTLSANTLYGTATGGGGSSLNGTVFAININGTGFTNLYNFTATSGTNYTNSDGTAPEARLILSGNTLYGTAAGGGSGGAGSVFAVNTNGTGFINLHSFAAVSDGGSPRGLVLSSNTLYGAAYWGGSGGWGTIFSVNTDGTGFTNLHTFFTSDDGSHPAGLVLSGNTLYGATQQGGFWHAGTVFAVNTNGTGFTNLYTFAPTDLLGDAYTNGVEPLAGLILSGNTLYGTTMSEGSGGYGTVFSLSLGAPQLTIIPAGAYVILTWPSNPAGFTLQSTTNLGSTAVWTNNSLGPVIANGQNTVTNPISGAQQFFRLSQ